VVSSQWNEVKDEGVNEKRLSFTLSLQPTRAGPRLSQVKSPK
jgi:hypothetical protein